MRTSQFLGNCAAIATLLLGIGSGFGSVAALEITQLPPGAADAAQDAIRINSPTRDFFNRGRKGFEDEIRQLNLGSDLSIFGDDILTIDESLEHENWLYPLEEGEAQLEVQQFRIISPTE